MKNTLKGAACALILILILSLCSCGDKKPATASFEAMDTAMTLTVYGGKDNVCQTLQDRITALDALLDATDKNSEIYHLNTEKTASVSDDTATLLNESLRLCGKLDGSFDITVYPAVEEWGFTTGEYKVPDDKRLSELAANIDYRTIQSDGNTFTLNEKTKLDLGAVAKGYAADVSVDIVKENNAQAAVLNLGGTIALYGKKPDGSRFTVGVADPDSPASYFGTLSCDKGFIATSGGYERYFERDGKRYIHILDPKTAKPVDNGVLSVTIICDKGADADALSTALFVMGLDKATEYYQNTGGFEFIILTEDDNLYITDGVYDDFTLSDGYSYTLHKVKGSLIS